MSESIISVRNLGKRYRIGLGKKQADTFFDAARSAVLAPFRNYRQIRNLTQGAREEESLFWALSDVSFEVNQGQILGIIGANGAGKSTLLKVLARISDPTTGEAIIKGRVSALLEVGTGFHPELTGRENVYMNGTIHGMRKKEIDRKLDEIVDFSGIEHHIDTAVKFYSSGMKVRLGFAVAAHLEPEILIIDEVLSVGDAEFQKKCLGKMDDISSKSGRTVLFVSHDLSAVSQICNTGMLLQNGRVEKFGSVDEVVMEYFKRVNSTDRFTSRIGDSIEVLDVSVSEKIVRTYDPLRFIFTLRAPSQFAIYGIAVFIYNKENQRIAVVDISMSLSGKDKKSEYVFETTLASLPLVPNDYNLGLSLNSSLHRGNAYDLISFSVIENEEEVLQYHVASRGFVKLTHTSKMH